MGNNNKQQKFLDTWIKKIAKEETDLTIKRHIVRHAKEIYKKPPQKWADSMRNLLEIFEAMNKLNPDVNRQIERLYNKYNKDKRRYTKPPNKN